VPVHDDEIDRFFQKELIWESDECLLWPFGQNGGGYAKLNRFLRIDGTNKVGRVICLLKHGKPPSKEHEAAHSPICISSLCINHKHLRWATKKENMADKIACGTSLRGKRNHNTKLTESDVYQQFVVIRRHPQRLWQGNTKWENQL
jgi:hypothetical protein